jgi:uncharacterized protein
METDAATVLLTLRRRRGLTQAELAARAGTSQPVVSAYERGHRDPSIGTLKRLVEATGERLTLSTYLPDVGAIAPGDLEEHARRLVDVLSLVDAVPVRPRSLHLDAPRLVSR